MIARSGVCSASVMISSSGRRTPRPSAVRAPSDAGVAVHRWQQPLEHRREQLAPCGRVLPGRQRFREPGFERRQPPAQFGELDGQPPGFGDCVVIVRRAQQPAERIRRFLFVAAADQEPRERKRRRRVGVTGDRGPVGCDRQVISTRARLQIADARKRLRIGAGGGRRSRGTERA